MIFVYGNQANLVSSQLKQRIKVAYIDTPSDEIDWKQIWEGVLPLRIKHFLWLAMHQLLLTNVERAKRNLTNGSCCIICGDSQETRLHVLRDCSFASKV